MKKINIDREWEFMLGEPSSIPGMPNKVRTVNLPHDFMIESDVKVDSVNGTNTGFYNGDTGSYTKYLDIPQEWSGQRVFVEFDGTFRDTTVILNGHIMGRHHYGYTPFRVELSKRLKWGKKNRLTVIVSNDAEQNSRWYPGGGIYRHVNLLVAPQAHIAPDGIFVHTDHIVKEDAFVAAEVTVENHTAQEQNLWVNIKFSRDREEGIVAEGAVKVHIPADSEAIARTMVCVENAAVWDIDSPNLYTVTADLADRRPIDQAEGMKILDSTQTLFGIRTISMDAKNGFMLNGKSLKLKGGCIHHDNGILGAASFYESEFRKVKLHKENGYNALRFAHNPMSSDLLEACDRLGILVMNEAFDTWNMPKNRHDFCRHFESEWQQEMKSFIIRDRNHPCVIIWSIGNELPEQGGLSEGYQTSAELAEYARSLDSTRFIGGAMCSFFNGLDDEDSGKFWESLMSEAMSSGGALNNLDGKYGREIWNDYTESFCAPWDVAGYNYLDYHYEEAGKLFPNRVICATESKPYQMEKYWSDVEKYPYLIGDFIWTSHDYIGEAGIGKTLYAKKEEAEAAEKTLNFTQYPWRTSGAGDFDLCGFEKPQLAYHRIIWGSDETYIACHNPANFDKAELLGRYGWPECANSWTWDAEAGCDVKVEVYSSAEEVELFINGVSAGRQSAGKSNHNTACFTVKYEPGLLEAVSYTGGKEVSRDSVKSAGVPTGLKIRPDEYALRQNVLSSDGQSLCFAVVEVVDAEGNLIPYAEAEVHAKVEGAAVLAAFGTGRPVTEENYTVGKVVSWHGKILAVVRSGYEAGTAKLTVSAEGLASAELEITVE
ncbi:MAG: glycoside hydrolase family 2 TIM barrel-domain containing protein [Eubacteriales bacterium]|nr:glycoside hydrolase family 2 TIM barrel-domain containing protein [Eubacteriales bacterium]